MQQAKFYYKDEPAQYGDLRIFYIDSQRIGRVYEMVGWFVAHQGLSPSNARRQALKIKSYEEVFK
jgi:hypothetical protein